MTLGENEIEVAALQMDPRSRARLAEKLLASLDALSEPEIEAMWVEEAERRDADLDASAEQARPGDEVMRDARQRLG